MATFLLINYFLVNFRTSRDLSLPVFDGNVINETKKENLALVTPD